MDRGFFIDGEWRKPKGKETFVVLDPATGEFVGSTLLADAEIVDMAVAAAKRVEKSFAAMPAEERAAILKRAADLIEARVEDMAVLLTREQGKPVPDNRKEILFGATVLRYYAEEATRIFGSLRPAQAPDAYTVIESLQDLLD